MRIACIEEWCIYFALRVVEQLPGMNDQRQQDRISQFPINIFTIRKMPKFIVGPVPMPATHIRSLIQR